MASLLGVLRAARADSAVTALLARHPAEQACLKSSYGVAALLDALCETGADSAFATLAARAAENARRDDSYGLEVLLNAVRRAGDSDAATTLASRAAEAAAAAEPARRALEEALRGHGYDTAADIAKFTRIGAAEPWNGPAHGREPDDTISQHWDWEEPA